MYKTHDSKGGKVFLNAVMHELVQRPLDAAMEEVPPYPRSFEGQLISDPGFGSCIS